MTVSLTRFDGSIDSLRIALELCYGLELRPKLDTPSVLLYGNCALSKAAGAYPCQEVPLGLSFA